MRRSKSDPAKYARNYRKISQRHMTQYDHIDEEKEIERLRAVLKNSEQHIKNSLGKDDDNDDDDNNNNNRPSSSSSQSNKKRKQQDSYKDNRSVSNLNDGDDDNDDKKNQESGILSGDFLEQSGYVNPSSSENPLIVLPSKKKAKKNKSAKVELTPEELKEAKNLQKKTAKKLQQLETRAAQKKRRAELYKKLENTQLSKTVVPLLSSSGNLSRKDRDTKKQKLKKLIKKERAGIILTESEKELLYPERTVDESSSPSGAMLISDTLSVQQSTPNGTKTGQRDNDSGKTTKGDDGKSAPKNKSKKEKQSNKHSHDSDSEKTDEDATPKESTAPEESSKIDSSETNKAKEISTPKEEKNPVIDFAAQMMATLAKLKEETTKKAQEAAKEKEDDLEDTGVAAKKRYVPSAPTVLKTAASLGIQGSALESKRTVMRIQRPAAVEATRLNLPVSAMEFEIMDTIRNNDVTIICGETGSGKSTQVPQYLYEGGMCSCDADPESNFLVGITQPRRVAAVSTAKRVCYEMGQGDGQSIKGSGNNGNLVSYRTRYEKAGIGSKTRVQFMTDGILLQEIQSDLLLRRYSVIVLDESHERNLNTDVLIGLLSVALPLRKQAAEQDPKLVPLKLVLMSATLRVEDFTKNTKLFPTGPPAVVTVPGRTHPVTVHHSKTTELDDYETAAFRKICKIHRRLPDGGILVFLTGKNEIIRMVNRLRRALRSGSTVGQGRCTGSNDVGSDGTNLNDIDGAPREMDDDDFDAENIGDEAEEDDDFDEAENSIEPTSEDNTDGNIPKNAYIMPLYSLLSAEEQAKVFSPPPEGHRLIVIATNIAETSITIPGISYVIDSGRQKCRNYNSSTGVVSYDVMWISKASADQRAGRAGRTGPGHCYRLYSSSLYSRHMDPFALPEVLTRPLEDVVLAMKSLNVSDVAAFPFPTPPDRSQVDAAVKLLANLGCVDISNVEREGGDGVVTRLGRAVAKLPLGVRYAKMLLVGAQAGVLDYTIVVVSILSEASPFQDGSHSEDKTHEDDERGENTQDDDSLDDVDQHRIEDLEKKKKKQRHWHHKSGDVLAAMLAVGGFTYAGHGAGGVSEEVAGRKFCDENGLNYVIMTRIQKMRSNLARLAKSRLPSADGVASKTGGYSSKMKPPNNLQERLLLQTIASGLLDNIAVLAPPGSFPGDGEMRSRSGYMSCSSSKKEPLFLDRNSVISNRDYRQLPKWICYNTVLRKTTKTGTPILVVKVVTPVDPSWLGELAKGTRLISYGVPLLSPSPRYNEANDCVECCVTTKFGNHGWEIPPVHKVMYDALQLPEAKHSSEILLDDSFRWFAQFLLEGKVISELKGLKSILNDNPTIITKRKPLAKVSTIVSALSSAGVDSASALRKHWAETDDKFLFKQLKSWVREDNLSEGKKIWIEAVKSNVNKWRKRK